MRRRGLLAYSLIAAAASGHARAQDLTGAATSGFLTAVMMNEMFETESARILLARSQHPQIRAYAEKMIADHAMMSDELRGILASGVLAGSAMGVPAGLGPQRLALLDTLRRQEEADWLNRYYVDQQVDEHQAAIGAFEDYIRQGNVDVLRVFAQKHLPMIRQHLEMARMLQLPAASR
jgi:putative membrane protein